MLNKKIPQPQKQKRKNAKKRTSVIKLAHPAAAKLNLLHRTHTGKVVHRHHTSYGFLLILLVITAFFIFVGYDISAAVSNPQDGTVTVGLTVTDHPPFDGAVITSPSDNTVSKQAIIGVSGTCVPDTEVIIYSNHTLVGSTVCSSLSTFQLTIQLFAGLNSLTALNYDALNRPGPSTPAVRVTYGVSSSSSQPLTVLPIVIAGNSCDHYIRDDNMPQSSEVRVAVACMERYTDTSGKTTIGIALWGGTSPYALTIDWGDGSAVELKSVTKAGYFTVTKNYQYKGDYTVTLQASDANGKKAYAQATLEVSGKSQPNSSFAAYIGQNISTSWFNSPVPTYLLAVAIVLGFWAGDYFERLLLPGNKTRASKRRHA